MLSNNDNKNDFDNAIVVKVQTTPAYEGLPLPAYESAQAAGLDLLACLKEEVALRPGERALIPTGIRLELPPGVEAQVRPRSGLALRYGLGLVNSPGTIDADYRGEVGVLLINWGTETFVVRRGMRIAQLVFARYLTARLQPEIELSATKRGEGGFGHSGL